MSHVILIHGLVNGEASRFDGEYFVSLDFWQCGPGECNLITTLDPAKAKHFDDVETAHQTWVAVDPRQPTRPHDGKPNRPLTAFSVSIEPYTDRLDLNRPCACGDPDCPIPLPCMCGEPDCTSGQGEHKVEHVGQTA